jgi:hypothetical protein
MADRAEHTIADAAGRDISPALSDFSELTILSRSPSPIRNYNPRYTRLKSDLIDTNHVINKLRGHDGRYVSRKRAHSPEERYAAHHQGKRLVLTASQIDKRRQFNEQPYIYS